MAIPHAESGDVIDIRPYGAQIDAAITKALFKSEQLEVIRMVLLAGRSVPEHSVPGEITVQCIEGKVNFNTALGTQQLSAGTLLHLSGNVPYSIDAVENASLLITIRLVHDAAKEMESRSIGA